MPTESKANHGPYSVNADGSVHELNLGRVRLITEEGDVQMYAIKARDNDKLIFGTPSFAHCGFGCKERIPIIIETSRVVGFGVGAFDKTERGAGDAVVSVGTALVAPLLLIPMAMATKESSYEYVIAFVDSNGKLNRQTITLHSGEDVKSLANYLKLSTGLEPGKTLDEPKTRQLQEKALIDLENKYQQALVRASIPGPLNKPWCTKYDMSGDTESSKIVVASFQKLNQLRKILGKPLIDKPTPQIDVAFREYLEINPKLKSWATRNPSTAKIFKACTNQ